MIYKISIVVNTYNRASSLKQTLEAFSFLRYPNYEVVVVNGPSNDNTEEVLKEYLDNIKVGYCSEANLSKSRNIGIGLASGDIICFIDDDGIPEPDWLNSIAKAYDEDDRIGAVGGWVRDHTGVDYQCRYIVCDRFGDASFYENIEDASKVVDIGPGAEYYYSLIGVNSSFRRDALMEISGFDEEYAYFLDETDVCVRLIDSGWKIKFAPDAEVHHKYAPSHLRNEKKIPTSLYNTCRSKVYFQFRNALPGVGCEYIFRKAIRVRQEIQWDVDNLHRFDLIDSEQYAKLSDDLTRGLKDGIKDAFAYPVGRPMPEAVKFNLPFKAFKSKLATSERLNLILISQDYPPNNCGGVGVLMHNLATGLAMQGHEVSVITKSNGRHTVDMEDGVWVHRVPITMHGNRSYPELPELPGLVRDHAYTVYDEALRIQARRGAATTLSTIWDLESAACVASNAFTNFVYLVTTYQLVLPNKSEWQTNQHFLTNHVYKMIEGERWLLEKCQQVIASTAAILSDINLLNPNLRMQNAVPVIPFGLPDVQKYQVSKPKNYPVDSVTILFVGRFESRKGVDLLLEVMPSLLEKYPKLNIRLAGDTSIIVDGETVKNRFLKHYQNSEKWLSRVNFLEFITDESLNSEYAYCDIFVAPSRYESFGLIYLEAMRWGKPCIGTNIGGIPEVVTSKTGLLTEVGNAEQLKDAIELLIVDAQLRLKLGDAGRVRFKSEYTIAGFINRLLPLIKKY